MKKVVVFISLYMVGIAAFAQVQIDKPVQLTGTGTDAKITGIQSVTADPDAANKIYVDTAIANRAGGSTGNMTFSVTASASAITCPATGNTATSPLIIRATQTGGSAANLVYTISGVPANVTTTLTPGGGVPELSSQLTFTAAGATAGTYSVTITGTSGVNTSAVTITLRIGNRRVFVTSSGTSPSGGGLTSADNFCQARADAASLGGQYKAYIGTFSRQPRDIIQDGPYMMVNGTLVANNRADFYDGSIAAAINRTETNGTYTGQVATGARSYGVVSLCNGGSACNCDEWTNPSGSILIMGEANQTGGSWGDCNCGPNCSSGPFRLYCFEQ